VLHINQVFFLGANVDTSGSVDKWLIFSIAGAVLVLDKTHASRLFLRFPGIYMLLDRLISGMSKPQYNLVPNM
jgi:hypothetical protein